MGQDWSGWDSGLEHPDPIGSLPVVVCGRVCPTLPFGLADICRRPAGHDGAHIADPSDAGSLWWTDVEDAEDDWWDAIR